MTYAGRQVNRFLRVPLVEIGFASLVLMGPPPPPESGEFENRNVSQLDTLKLVCLKNAQYKLDTTTSKTIR
jgi:hypothetical protein